MKKNKKVKHPSQKKDSNLTQKYFRGVIDKNKKGFAFFIFDQKNLEDLFIPNKSASALFHGDRVEVTLKSSKRIQSLKVLEHRFREIVGKYQPFSHVTPSKNSGSSASLLKAHDLRFTQLKPNDRKGSRAQKVEKRDEFSSRGKGWVIFEKKRAREEIFVHHPEISIQPEDWVRIELQFHQKGNFPVTGKVLEVFGQTLPASADLNMIASEFNLNESHSQKAVAEASAFKTTPAVESRLRKDLTKLPWITIDDELARDFDDAIFVEKNKNQYSLWVAIADVSYYVTPGSALDQEAEERSTSVYFPEKAFHMLPHELSENLCSLKPHEPRFALVAKIDYDLEGQKKGVTLIQALIQSKRRATYKEIHAEWVKNTGNQNWEYAPHFALYQLIRKKRRERGSIDFEFPEASIRVDSHGEPFAIENRARLESHRLIEEFMIAANESVTEWALHRKIPFIYRIHEEPSLVSLQKFQTLATSVGVDCTLKIPVSPGDIASAMKIFEGHSAQSLLTTSLLRAMKQATYSATHTLHFGLASTAYTHFTSPIRRYPDLIVHRLIRSILEGSLSQHSLSKKKTEDMNLRLSLLCTHCSFRERLATEAEREAIKLKQVRFMMKHIGESYESKIVGITSTGVFVQVADPFVEGLILMESLLKEAPYEFIEEKMILFERRQKKTLTIGDILPVKVVHASLERRQIDFEVHRR